MFFENQKSIPFGMDFLLLMTSTGLLLIICMSDIQKLDFLFKYSLSVTGLFLYLVWKQMKLKVIKKQVCFNSINLYGIV